MKLNFEQIDSMNDEQVLKTGQAVLASLIT